VPAEVLRDRLADVLTPVELVKKHPTYRMRGPPGPHRADMWACSITTRGFDQPSLPYDLRIVRHCPHSHARARALLPGRRTYPLDPSTSRDVTVHDPSRGQRLRTILGILSRIMKLLEQLLDRLPGRRSGDFTRSTVRGALDEFEPRPTSQEKHLTNREQTITFAAHRHAFPGNPS
jgi:hypothetical protein